MFEVDTKRYKTAIVILAMAVLIYFIYRIRIVLIPFVLGLILAYLLNPIINYLEKKNFSRRGALLLLSIGLFNLLFLAGLFLFPVFVDELHKLTNMIPEYISIIEELITDLNQQYRRISFPPLLKESMDQVLSDFEAGAVDYIHRLTEILLISIPLLVSLFISPLITYYLLKDKEEIKRAWAGLFPSEEDNLGIKLVEEINRVFVNFLRGQIWISLSVVIMISLGLYFLQVNFYIIFGLLAGITNLIPYIGPILGAIPVVFVTFLSSPLQAGAVILLYIVVQQVESILVTPRIMSESVGLHPLTIIFSLLAGAEIMGVPGLLLAVPTAGSLKVILNLIGGERPSGSG